jgi:hypothetical protein
MNAAELQSTILDANTALSLHRDLTCFSARRSVGSNVFLEFGTPVPKRVTPAMRPPFTIMEGQASIWLHDDSWCVLDGAHPILDSIDVDDASLQRVLESHFRGAALPTVGLSDEGLLTLAFERGVIITVEMSDYPEEEKHDSFEVRITMPSAALSFNYERGFYR